MERRRHNSVLLLVILLLLYTKGLEKGSIELIKLRISLLKKFCHLRTQVKNFLHENLTRENFSQLIFIEIRYDHMAQ